MAYANAEPAVKRFHLRLLAAYAALCWLFIGDVMASPLLTPAENAWLEEHPVIRFAPAPYYPPVEFFDDADVYRGITADFVTHIEKKLGIRFEILRYRSWDQIVRNTKAGKVDMWGAAAETPERQQYMNFTRDYIRLPAVIIVRKERPGPLSLNEMAGQRVVAIRNYASTAYIEENYPELDLIQVPDIPTGLKMVSSGLADAIVATNAAAIYYIEHQGITNLKLAGESGYEWKLRFAARKEHPEMIAILQKGLDAITDDEKRAIYSRWVSLEYPAWVLTREHLIQAGIALVVLLLASILYWNRLLSRKVAQQTAALTRELTERKALQEELTRLVNTDELTEISNRRHILELAEREMNRAVRYGNPLSLALLDVDFFKAINDTHGHPIGDKALRHLVDLSQKILRDSDFIGRFGGEEFLILLPETPYDEALHAMERLRKAIEQTPLTMDGDQAVQITVSMGVVELDHRLPDINRLLSLGDAALYAAKEQGRNRIVHANTQPTPVNPPS